MNRTALAAATLLMAGTSAHAIGLDRSGQNVAILFEEGDYAELSFGYVSPDISGSDEALFGGAGTGDVGNGYFTGALGYKQQVTDELSFAVIVDQPYGADITYSDGPQNGGSGSATLGGTGARVSSSALTALARYEFANRLSVHGGVRAQQISGSVDLDGGRFGGLAGYSANVDSDIDFGYVVGVAFERPEIALRVALTYFSEIDHEIDTFETIQTNFGPLTIGDVTDVTTPQAVNLDFQTGVAEDTLVFGQVRWADYDQVFLAPATFAGNTPDGSSLVGIQSNYRVSLGVGRRFTEAFAGSVSLAYEPEGDEFVSPLGPTNGQIGLTVGGTYDIGRVKLTGGINYTRLGDAAVQATDPNSGATTTTTTFDDNHAIGLGLRVGYRF